MRLAIWWIRRDLRLEDNRALSAALDDSDQIIPLFIYDDRLLKSSYAAEKRIGFLEGDLAALDTELRRRASYLVVRRGEPGAVLTDLIDELRATHHATAVAVYAEADVSPFADQRDEPLRRTLPIAFVDGVSILPIGSVQKTDSSPYTVFTPYSRRWKEILDGAEGDRRHPFHAMAAPSRLPTPEGLSSDPLPDRPLSSGASAFLPGESEAARRLTTFADGPDAPIYGYADNRDRPDLDATSQLSPYLRFGMLSPRRAASAAYQALRAAPDLQGRQGAQTWRDELIWRDFYLTILARFPHVRRGSFRAEYDRILWRNDDADFLAWCEGRTGYPFIDAAMRQLQAIGWMHNRARMAVASFLVKDLLIDWRWGERWFMQHLIDGDPAANNGGWQWAAGTGTDAAPYFRIFNPVNQGIKFDPHGAYVRQWVPELRALPTKNIHEPWRLSNSDLEQACCRLGVDYPFPIVDHAQARIRTLAAYKDAIKRRA